MRVFIILLLSTLGFSVSSIAQTVFAPQGAVWNYYREGEPPVYNNRFMVEKDTFYEGHYCSKIIGIKTFLDGSKEILNSNYCYTSGDTVLYYHDSLKAFTPLYIFDVHVGDTLTYAAPISFYKSFKTLKVIVSKVDTSIIDGIPLRTIHTKAIYPLTNLKYTERFGGFYCANIISIPLLTVVADFTENLRCYHDKEIDEKFVADKWDCDYIPTNIEEKTNKNNIEIYPNPASNLLNIRFNNIKLQGQITILGLDGRLFAQKEIRDSENQMYISYLKNGVYFLQIKSEKETILRLITVLN